MIRPDGFRGAAFGTVVEGDARFDDASRGAMSRTLGIPAEWATVTQVHGSRTVEAAEPGGLGEADAIYTFRVALPVAVATADCVPVILEGDGMVAVVHVGWRGAVAGVLDEALFAIERRGVEVERAAIGPAIGPCCYEVGEEVAEQFPAHTARTSWGTLSVDLGTAVADQLSSIPTWRSDRCTYTATDFFSYRRDRTAKRQVAVAWLPAGSNG